MIDRHRERRRRRKRKRKSERKCERKSEKEEKERTEERRGEKETEKTRGLLSAMHLNASAPRPNSMDQIHHTPFPLLIFFLRSRELCFGDVSLTVRR